MNRAILALVVMLAIPGSAFAQKGDLTLKSRAALIFDAQQGHAIYSKNTDTIMPIASITKLMTAMVVLDAQLPLSEEITIDSADIDVLKNTRSRLKIGSSLTRQQLLRLALLSSENRAAAALGRAYPGGIEAFVSAMNNKAFELGMGNSRFVDSTGLSSSNVSTARDLVKMVEAAHFYEEIRDFSTTTTHALNSPDYRRGLKYTNSNNLVSNVQWQIGVSKTGFLSAAGRCLVMQANITGKPVIIVLLDSNGKKTRIGDAIRIKQWMEASLTRKRSS